MARPIKNTTQIWVVTSHQYGISALVSQTSFRGETRGGLPKCRLFSQACSPATKHSLGNIFVVSTIKNLLSAENVKGIEVKTLLSDRIRDVAIKTHLILDPVHIFSIQ